MLIQCARIDLVAVIACCIGLGKFSQLKLLLFTVVCSGLSLVN
jgi:hypothetical protein